MILLDLFSGYGGFHKGLEQAGFKFTKTYFSEVDKHAIANYRYNFKDAEYVGSVTDVYKWRIERPNIITFGSPCQDFSLAGKRAGMDGERSSLITYAIRAIERFKPDFFIWENVKGTFSSNNGADFWAIIQAFTDIGGYRLEWQLLNTAWFLPQNRERIYLVGHSATSERGFRQVFPIGENGGKFIKPPPETPGERQRVWGYNSQANCISSRYYKDGSENLISVQPVIDVSGKNKTQNGKLVKESGQPAFTLQSVDKQGVMITSATKDGYEIANEGDSINFSVPNSNTRRGRVGKGKGKAQTLDTQCNQGVFVPVEYEFNGFIFEPPKTLDTQYNQRVIQINDSKESGGKQPYQQNRIYSKEGLAPCLDSNAGRWSINETKIRRLTEIECERLQGLPDNWTKWGMYEDKHGNLVKKEISSTQRYKLCGNGVTATVVQAIGERLLK